MEESLRELAGRIESGDLWVSITNKPMSCCGVLQQGWEGQVAYIINSADHPAVHGDIVVLTDGTLAWDYNCIVIEKPCLN